MLLVREGEETDSAVSGGTKGAVGENVGRNRNLADAARRLGDDQYACKLQAERLGDICRPVESRTQAIKQERAFPL